MQQSGIFPPTPTPSLPPSRPSSVAKLLDTFDMQNLPPTPPSNDSPSHSPLNFAEPDLPLRERKGRRPLSGYPLKAPLEHLLDVEEYEYDGESADLHMPTLSMVTTSTFESSTRTPSIGGVYGTPDMKHDGEGRIRIRQTAGRANAYSSAESSTASGAYSYTEPPPLPAPYDRVGLGISTDKRQGIVESPGASPLEQFAHRPWRRDIMNRLRSDSASSSITTDTMSSEASPEVYDYQYPVWQEAEAVAMVDEGRDNRLDVERLNKLGGVDALTEELISSLQGITHLLLPSYGSSLLSILPSLLIVLAPTLVVVDLSNNGLSFLPESLQYCSQLEELNVSGNPLRQLPSWLAGLASLKLLVADECNLAGLATDLRHLTRLHTLCARRNRLVSLPSWLCLLTHLETLRIDDNPFAKEWMPIVAPILANPPPGSLPLRSSFRRDLHSQPSVASLTSSLTASSIHSREIPETWLSPSSSAAGSMHLLPIAEDLPHSAPPMSEVYDDELQPPRAAALTGSSSMRNLRKMRSAGSLFGRGSISEQPKAGPSRQDGRNQRAATMLSRDIPVEEPKSKWGFLRKMSMNKLRPDKSNLSAGAAANLKSMPPLNHANSDPITTLPSRPGMSTAKSAMTLPSRKFTADMDEFGSLKASSSASTLPSKNLPPIPTATPRRGKRRSFLPVDIAPSLNVTIPSISPFMPSNPLLGQPDPPTDETDSRYASGLESIKSYLRDLYDLSRPVVETYRGFEILDSSETPSLVSRASISERNRRRRPTLDTQNSAVSIPSLHESEPSDEGKKFKDDRNKRAMIIREIWETERTYVRGLGELVQIYVKPASQPISKNTNETVVPLAERKIVFGAVESLLTIHRDNLLKSLESAVRPLIEGRDDEQGLLSAHTAHEVGRVFQEYITYMKQYTTYTNNFDNAVARLNMWKAPVTNPAVKSHGIGSAVASAGMSAISLPLQAETVPHSGAHMTPPQRKRVRTFLKRAREHPMHGQIDLQAYLLLPVQRIPRYKLLLEDLTMCTPRSATASDDLPDKLDLARDNITELASLMNEEKREAESRLRLFHWQQRITMRGPSPLVQPHRKLILDGDLNLIRLVKKESSFVEVDTTIFPMDGEQTIMPSKAIVPIDFIVPEPMDRSMCLVLCSDILVLVSPREGAGPDGPVDLFNVLRMGTMKEPASIVQNHILRVVDNKSIYYFSGGGKISTLEWCRAINSARRR